MATPQQSAAAAVAPGPAPAAPKESWLPQIEPRRGGTNFFVFSTWNEHRDDQPNERGLVEFQLDLAYDITRLDKWPEAGFFRLTFPFRLTSFWDLFDVLPGSDSAPFLETDYAPGLEVSWVVPPDLARFLAVRVGVLHGSNGLGSIGNGPDQRASSRSWNFVYAGATLEVPVPPLFQTRLDLVGWVPFGSDAVAAWPDGKDAGTRLQDHIGYFEAGADVRLVYPTLRLRAHEASLEAELRLPFKMAQIWDGVSLHGNGFRLDFLVHCHFGKGERLTTANESRSACYVGVGL